MIRRLLNTSCVLSVVLFLQSQVSACDCRTAHTISMGVPVFGGLAMGQPVFGSMAMADSGFEGSVAGGYGGLELPIAPMPPGTVGQTYSRTSHPIPGDEHPRTGMLAVRNDIGAPHLSVSSMGGIQLKSGVWLFESSRPLDPGACQIVRVEARHNLKDVAPYETRFVRLIPGRIVYLDF